jgi:hypothetical protein
MSKCQKNKYAAGGRCGGLSDCGSKQNPEINGNLAALIRSREKQDDTLFRQVPVEYLPANVEALKTSKIPDFKNTINVPNNTAIIPIKVQSKSDIDLILEGDC